MYSQNKEEQIILDYFRTIPIGHLIDIGANDGKTFSNSLALIESGWYATLVEPHPVAYEKLTQLHSNNSFAECIKVAICETNGKVTLNINSPHIEGDTGLLSTLVESETDKWASVVTYTKEDVIGLTFESFMKLNNLISFDFITIDAEGMDYIILSQIDLTKYGCKMVCVEHNGIDLEKYIHHCEQHGMKVKHVNPENLIMAL